MMTRTEEEKLRERRTNLLVELDLYEQGEIAIGSGVRTTLGSDEVYLYLHHRGEDFQISDISTEKLLTVSQRWLDETLTEAPEALKEEIERIERRLGIPTVKEKEAAEYQISKIVDIIVRIVDETDVDDKALMKRRLAPFIKSNILRPVFPPLRRRISVRPCIRHNHISNLSCFSGIKFICLSLVKVSLFSSDCLIIIPFILC